MTDDGTSVPVAAVRRHAGPRFAATFPAIACVLFAVYVFPYGESGASARFFDGYLSLYARVAGAVLGLFEPNIVVNGARSSRARR